MPPPRRRSPRPEPPPEGAEGDAGGSRYSLHHARHALRSRFAEDRLPAIVALQRIGSAEAAELLTGALRDRLSYVGAAAARALATMDYAGISESMVAHFERASENGLERDAGCSVRHEIAVALGNRRFARAEEILRLGLRTVQVEMVGFKLEDTAMALRANCALALAQIRPANVLIDLTLLLFDAGPDAPCISDTTTARKAAATAIGHLGDPAGGVPVALKLRTRTEEPESPDVLTECMNSLVALGDPRAQEFIAPFLEDQSGFLVAGAAIALGRTRNSAVLPALLQALDRVSSDLATAVATAVATLRVPEAREALLQRTGHRSPGLRAACIQALAVFPDQEVQARLQHLAREERDPRARAAAQRAIGEKE